MDAPDPARTAPQLVAAQLASLHRADQRLVRTVDSLTEDQWRGPSLLPGWTRAHVVAHLALNAEGFSGALEAIDRGAREPIYPSEAARDADIADLATAGSGRIRERLFAATTRFRDAIEGLTGSQWTHTVDRLPGGPAWPAADLPATRRREVEIHHADLDAGYTPRDWPLDFAVDLLDQVTLDQAAADGRFTVRATDAARDWAVGAAAPVVTGTAADLGWWLTGRGHAEGLSVDGGGELPTIGAWRRVPQPPAR